MAERSWTTVDKSDWGPGPWQDEPDKIQWIDEATGLDCLIHRGSIGALCGYVGVPKGHPAYGVGYDDVKVAGEWPDVHGGLTYADRCQETDDESDGICHVPEPGRPHDVWWLGFDCGHSGDICPKIEMALRSSLMGGPISGWPWPVYYKPVSYVRAEVSSLAKQLART
jgi:hypothetical protein